MNLKSIPMLLFLAGLLTGCGSGKPAGGKEATLADLNRAVATVTMANGGKPPDSPDALTNLLSQQGLRLPTPPPGQKIQIDAQGQVVFAGK